MSKRKGAADILAEVEDSKKIKEEALSENSAKEESSESTAEPLKYLQIIVTGHKGCGKSCLVCSYMRQRFPQSGRDFLSKQYLKILPEKDVMIWDLDARVQYSKYRQQSYQEADIALLCFDIKKSSMEGKECPLETLLQPWIAELDQHCEDIPIILVGLKGDSRMNFEANVYSEAEIKTAAKKYPRIKCYREVSAYMDRTGVDELFKEAITAIDAQKQKIMFSQYSFKIGQFHWLI